ncbi:metal ABC transporter solute-binding protein, Zn/Mn family [Halarcobacter ebronensis]|uniref:Cation ABC transporter substrate-binding protein n=1 Tax=Halarcobacter ebronensis TaxID=1462615 RepID=A0A4Q1B0M8_9BACT|nr:zinc ABC transporter substrate-binding protein [Halarcobacter ebronensis]QKF80782.1 metal ion ABC transporter, periplasmic metal-binding protein [Halarcobacter ebronensis]RXK08573.1 hypothetical protein CRV07_01870 [Halarcobacter ebronensis]
MKYIISILLLSTFLFAKIDIVVSILPQKTFVEKIGGDKVTVTAMVKPGSDPHSYEPKPSQMKAITKAQLYFPIKIEFENAWLDKFANQNSTMQFIDMTKGIEFLKMPAHHHHHHETSEVDLPYEWAGLFDLKKGVYSWSFSKVEGKYAEPSMKFLIKKASKDTSTIEQYEEEAKKEFSSPNITEVEDNYKLNPNSFYELNFDKNKEVSTFKIDIKEDGKYLFFTEHMPTEFEGHEHFFKDINKNDIEASLTHPEESEHEHHHHGEFDPHTWTSPANVKIMAKNIFDALVKVDGKNKKYYETNYKTFLAEIDKTDSTIRKILSNIPKKSKFMVFHPSWGYFARDYDLVQFPIEVEGKEPKPKMLEKIIDEAKEENVKAIFAQEEFSDKSAKAIASELNIKVIKETPLSANWSENLIKMAKAIDNIN